VELIPVVSAEIDRTRRRNSNGATTFAAAAVIVERLSPVYGILEQVGALDCKVLMALTVPEGATASNGEEG
jgi:hypothetical protein